MFKKWLKIFLTLLLGVPIVLFSCVGLVFIAFDDDDYRRELIRFVRLYTDYQLVIDGEFQTRLSLSPAVSVSSVTLYSDSEPHVFEFGRLEFQLALRSLLDGVLRVQRLAVEDAEIALTTGEGEDGNGEHDVLSRLALLDNLLLEKVSLRNVRISFNQESQDRVRQIRVQEFVVRDVVNHRPLSFSGKGVASGTDFSVAGTIGSLQDITRPNAPYPVDVKLRSRGMNFSVSGVIANIEQWSGLDLDIAMDASSLDPAIAMMGVELPSLGGLQASAKLQGDLNSLSLKRLNLVLNRGKLLDVQVEASMDDLLAGKGLQAKVSGAVSDTEMLRWLLPEEMYGITWLTFDGTVTSDGQGFRLSDVTAQGTNARGLRVDMRGKGILADLSADQPFSELDVLIDVLSPDTETVKGYLIEGLPELGASVGRVRLTAPSHQDLAVEDIDVRLGRPEELQLAVTGRIAKIPLDANVPSSGFDLGLIVTAARTERVAYLFDRSLPEVGPVTMKGRFAGSKQKSSLDNLLIRAGTEGGLVLEADGALGNISFNDEMSVSGVGIHVTAKAPSVTAFRPLVDKELPDMGPVEIRGFLRDLDGSLGLEDGVIQIGASSDPALLVKGSIDNLQDRKEISCEGEFKLTTASLLSAYLEHPVSDLGLVEGNFSLSDSDGSLGLESLHLASSQTDLFQLELHGIFDDLLQKAMFDLQADFSSSDLGFLHELFDREIPHLAPLKAKGRLSGDVGKGGFEGRLTVGQTEITGTVSGALNGDHPRLRGKISSPVFHLADFGIRPREAEAEGDKLWEKPARKQPDAVKKKKGPLFSREAIPLDFLQALDLSLAVAVEKIEGIDTSLNGIDVKLELASGKLDVDPMSFSFKGGAVQGSFSLDGSSAPPRMKLAAEAEDVDLAGTLAYIKNSFPLEGNLNLHVDVASSGISPHELAANLDGHFQLALENGRMPRSMMNLLAVDILGWGISKTIQREKHAVIDCALIGLEAESGLLQSKTFVMDSPRLLLTGEGEVDLASETMQLSLYPKKKKRFWSTITPVNIKGPIQKPSVTALPVASTGVVAGGYILAPQIFLPVTGVNYLWEMIAKDKDNGGKSPCLQGITND